MFIKFLFTSLNLLSSLLCLILSAWSSQSFWRENNCWRWVTNITFFSFLHQSDIINMWHVHPFRRNMWKCNKKNVCYKKKKKEINGREMQARRRQLPKSVREKKGCKKEIKRIKKSKPRQWACSRDLKGLC